jgi:hypothetical protein
MKNIMIYHKQRTYSTKDLKKNNKEKEKYGESKKNVGAANKNNK